VNFAAGRLALARGARAPVSKVVLKASSGAIAAAMADG